MFEAYLTYYCLLVLLASIFGGMLPVWFQWTHRLMEMAVSFVAGIMFGVAMLHLLPHALETATRQDSSLTISGLMLWCVGGFLVMFLIERFFCFHHHDAPAEEHEHGESCHHEHPHSDHVHDITWTGATIGMTLHSLLAGVALAASVAHSTSSAWLPGFGAFLVIFLHKPFDSMTIGTLMARSGWSITTRCVVNALFSLTIPLGALAFVMGLSLDGSANEYLTAPALAFSAGLFLCIAGSDLLPELQFHHHDRWKLSAALIAGLAVAYAAGQLESGIHKHEAPVDGETKETMHLTPRVDRVAINPSLYGETPSA